MPDQSPFARYLGQVEARLRSLPPARRDQIRRELLAHLADAAAEHASDPNDHAFQSALIAQLGPASDLAASFGAVHGAVPAALWRLATLAGLLGGLLGLFGGLLAEGLAPNAGMAGPLAAAALALAGALGAAGALQRERQRAAGMPLVLGCGLALAAAGALLLHGPLARSFDLPGGELMLFSGTLLLLNAAVHPVLVRLPRRYKLGLAALGLALASVLAPFSYLPNPIGAYYLVRGGYAYQPGALWRRRQPDFY